MSFQQRVIFFESYARGLLFFLFFFLCYVEDIMDVLFFFLCHMMHSVLNCCIVPRLKKNSANFSLEASSPPRTPGAAMDQRRASRVERHKRTTLGLVNGWCHALKCSPRGRFAPLPAGFADTEET